MARKHRHQCVIIMIHWSTILFFISARLWRGASKRVFYAPKRVLLTRQTRRAARRMPSLSVTECSCCISLQFMYMSESFHTVQHCNILSISVLCCLPHATPQYQDSQNQDGQNCDSAKSNYGNLQTLPSNRYCVDNFLQIIHSDLLNFVNFPIDFDTAIFLL